MVTDPTWAAILTALAKPLAAEVARHLRSELKSEQYDSREHLPPGTSARQFRTTCKRIPEAFRAGAVWNCPVTAWENHHRAQALPADESGEVDAYQAAVAKAGRQ